MKNLMLSLPLLISFACSHTGGSHTGHAHMCKKHGTDNGSCQEKSCEDCLGESAKVHKCEKHQNKEEFPSPLRNRH